MARVENGYDVEKYLKSNLDTVKWVSGGPHDDLFIFEVQAGLKNGKSGYDRISGVIRWIEGDSASNIWAKKREGENLDGVRKERITFKKAAESFNSVRSTNSVVTNALNSKVAMNASPEAFIRAEFNRLSAKGERLKKEYKNVTNELRKIKMEFQELELDAKKFNLKKLEDEIFRYRITYTNC